MTNLVKNNAQQSATPLEERGWIEAVHLVARWLEQRERIDALLEEMPQRLNSVERAHCQGLLLGVVRHHERLQRLLKARLARPPRRILESILLVGAFELLEQKADRAAKVVHYCVEKAKQLASPAEARLVNAVLRRVAEGLSSQESPGKLASSQVLAGFFSHPDWLVARWLAQFGNAGTRALLEWNATPASVFARWRNQHSPAPDWLEATPWSEFYRVPPGRWTDVEQLLKTGQLFIQDPATRLAVELLDPKSGENVIDICAAPGGKSVFIADRLRSGLLVAVDLPGERQKRLEENLSRIQGPVVKRLEADVLQGLVPRLQSNGLPASYDAVFLDVPCSNTGVMRHRMDVKERLQPGDFVRHSNQQIRLLTAAAELVAPGGRLVYSTCSIDPEENERVVGAFLRRSGGTFHLEEKRLSFPPETGHDGAGAYRLLRAGSKVSDLGSQPGR